MTPESLTWDVARAGGMLAYALLTLSVALGIALSLGWKSRLWTRFVTNEVHRFVTLVSLVFVGVHTLAVAIDPFIGFTPAEVLVPFASHYRTTWVALGIVAAYLLVAVYASEWVRPRIGYRLWRAFHYLTFAAFALSLVHGVATGSDTRTAWALALYGGSVVLVGALLVARLVPADPAKRHPVAAASSASLLVLGLVWATAGPLRVGWNQVANDGQGSGARGAAAASIAQRSAQRPAPPSQRPVEATPAPLPSPVQSQFEGRAVRGDGQSVLVQGTLSTGNSMLIQLDSLDGTGSDLGRISLQGTDGRVCQGPITQIGDSDVTGTCSTSDGATWRVTFTILEAERGRVAGTVVATPARSASQQGSGSGG